MKILKVLFLIHLLFISFAEPSFAIYTIHKTYNLDLSNNAILCMHQDNDGYMWFGTYDGLNLYNGKNVFVYRFEMDNPNTLSSNIIHKISHADKDHLWISTFLGLNKFSLKERKVTETYTECPEARLIASDKKGNCWVICKKNYISYYTAKSKKFRDIHFPGINVDNVIEIFADNDDKLCIAMADGKMKKIIFSDQQGYYNPEITVTEVKIHNKNITNIFYENGKIYFINSSGQLFLYDTAGLDPKDIFLSDLSRLMNVYGRISGFFSFNNIFFVSFNTGGVFMLDAKNGYIPETVSTGIGIFCILKDKKQDLIWIGTDGHGVQLYYQSHEIFKNITFNNLPVKIQKPVRSVYTDEYDNLWIGTKGDGIIKIKNYEELHNQVVPPSLYRHFTTENGLSNNSVFCFLQSKFYNIIWIGTDGPGLSYYSYRDNKIKTLPSRQIGKVHSICEINSETLWLATAGNGLLEVTLNEKNAQLSVRRVNEFFPKKGDRVCNEFHSMSYDGKSTLFVGSRGGYGVLRFNVVSKQYEFIRMNRGENSAIGDVLCVHQSKDSTFYIGASSGMTKIRFLADGNNTVKQFDRKNGIANDMIHGILEDGDGFIIWLSTNKGLTKYNPQNDFFHNYSHPELSVTEFSDDAYWKSPQTNRLFFGGINGLVWVDPDKDLPPVNYKPELNFFDLKISGERHALKDYMNKDGHIKLPSNISSFTISFIALDYINGDNYEYSYFLENYNTAWTELQKTNEVTFTNLPYGDYILKVKYKNDVFGSETEYYSLNITKLAPWYFTVFAFIGYSILFLLTCAYILYTIHRRITKKQILIAKKIREEQKEKLLEAKLNFFTNVTHEFCTPLTVIKGVSDYIEKSAEVDKNICKYTGILRDNVANLSGLIQEILDFRKMEEGKSNFSYIEEASISGLIRKQMEWFIPVAEENRITFEISMPDNLYWNTNIFGFNRVLVNLLSNAFKYAAEGGTVKISAEINDGQLSLLVYNTGHGIEESKIPFIFDRYGVPESMEANNSYSLMTSRHGLGLSICHDIVESLDGNISVRSEVGKFAEFMVVLPVLPVTASEQDRDGKSIDPENEELLIEVAGEKQTVLIVDDNKDIVWLISDILSGSYHIRSAYNVTEALKIIESETLSLIITDIMMPGMDGLEFINKLKNDKLTKHIPLVIVSAKISEKDQAEGLDIGADVYLTKPFSPLVLRSVINRLLAVKDELKDYFYSPESAYKYSDGQLIHQDDKAFTDSVIDIISDNVTDENLRPEFIAEKLNLNTRTLYRKLKKTTALSPNDFIKDYRFALAARLLITTNHTIQEIMYKTGISNKSYFYREFLKKYNMTPREYRIRK
ncbi:MAG: response regulator [Prevotella sp.]|jgi:signal transduction histidine kinase/CheY-like chemotaxis protein/ligand-binding sensor domain-containing protein/AraC-like DNA-binding protein|nr:response regulator [Prevotella sp.]